MSVLQHLDALERALIDKGFPAMTDWWRSEVTRFYSTDRRQFVLRVGRRGGKSSTLCRIAVLEALFGDHRVSQGDVGIVALISVNRDQANERLRTIKAILDALGMKYRPIEGGIELEGKPVAFKTFAASMQGVVGFTAICVIADEVARWRDAETGANPAREVLASLRPTMAGQRARIFLSSSPLGRLDAHYDAFERGEDDLQLTAYAPTWVARPGLTKEETQRLESDPRIWAREYQAVPSETVSPALDPDQVRACLRPPSRGHGLGQSVLSVDWAQGHGDGRGRLCAQFVQPEIDDVDIYKNEEIAPGQHVFPLGPGGMKIRKSETPPTPRPELHIFDIHCIEGRWAGPGVFDRIVADDARVADYYGITTVLADQYMDEFLRAVYAKHQLDYATNNWTNESKQDALAQVRLWLGEGTLVIEPTAEGRKLADEMIRLTEVIRPSGAVTIGARAGHHDDRWACLANVAMAQAALLLPGSPVHRDRRVRIIGGRAQF